MQICSSAIEDYGEFDKLSGAYTDGAVFKIKIVLLRFRKKK